jgi:hypothetical protein
MVPDGGGGSGGGGAEGKVLEISDTTQPDKKIARTP